MINTQNNTYISVFNPTKISNNVIDQNGTLVFNKDNYDSIYPQFEGFATYKPSESEEPLVYNFETKKNVVFPAKYNVFNTLNNSKLFVLKNKETEEFALFDPKTSKVIFSSKYEISDITEISNENNSKENKSKSYFIEYVSKSETRVVDTKGNAILSGNFNVKYFNESTKEFYLDDNASSLLNQKNNYYNIETKSYKFPEFVKDINSNNFLLWYKRNDYATVINKIDNNTLYTDSDFVKDVTTHSTNLSLILKQKPGEPYFYDIYSGITNKVIFKDTKGLSYIDGTSKYLKLSITFSSFAIVDLNGDIILKERNNPDGKLKFNKGKFDVVDRKGKVKETIERD